MNENLYITQRDYDLLMGFTGSINLSDVNEKTTFKLLEDKLKYAIIVEPENMPEHVVTMNSTVCFKFVRYQENLTYTLVYPKEADISQKKISILTPVGIALLGHKEGDSFEAAVPSGTENILIAKVVHKPENEGL